MAREVIKCCPFCGGRGKVKATYSEKHGHYVIYVICEACKARGRGFSSGDSEAGADWNAGRQDAIAAWNMRTRKAAGQC